MVSHRYNVDTYYSALYYRDTSNQIDVLQQVDDCPVDATMSRARPADGHLTHTHTKILVDVDKEMHQSMIITQYFVCVERYAVDCSDVCCPNCVQC